MKTNDYAKSQTRDSFSFLRRLSSKTKASPKNSTTLLYCLSFAVGLVGVVYTSVPLYRLFCQKSGFAGTPKKVDDRADFSSIKPVPGARKIPIIFDSHVSNTLPWNFRPQQPSVSVIPGQTSLAFYRASNKSCQPIRGVATYNVVPSKAAQYFNKIQCFCFEEQILDGNESIDMPIFFYVDPEFAFDPSMDNVQQIILSYTFFQSK